MIWSLYSGICLCFVDNMKRDPSLKSLQVTRGNQFGNGHQALEEAWQPIIILWQIMPDLHCVRPTSHPTHHACMPWGRRGCSRRSFCRLVRLNTTASRSPATAFEWNAYHILHCIVVLIILVGSYECETFTWPDGLRRNQMKLENIIYHYTYVCVINIFNLNVVCGQTL